MLGCTVFAGKGKYRMNAWRESRHRPNTRLKRASHALPFLVLDTSAIRKLEIKYTHFNERAGTAPDEAYPYLQTPYGFLDWLAHDLHITVIIPRAVIREMLRRNDGKINDLFLSQTQTGGRPQLMLHSETQKLHADAKSFGNFLRMKSVRTMGQDRSALRLYPSCAAMLDGEIGKPPGGFVIVNSTIEEPLTGTGIRNRLEQGAQEGDDAIRLFCRTLARLTPKPHPAFPILTEDMDLRISINDAASLGASYATGLRGFLKSSRWKDDHSKNICTGFITALDYQAEREKEKAFFFKAMVFHGRQWHDLIESHGREKPLIDPRKTHQVAGAEKLRPKNGFTTLHLPPPPPILTEKLLAEPPEVTLSEPEKPPLEVKKGPAAITRENLGPGSRMPYSESKPLTFNPRKGTLSDAELKRREEALRNAKNAHRR